MLVGIIKWPCNGLMISAYGARQGYALMFDIAVQSGSMNPKVGGVTQDLIGEINTWYAGISINRQNSHAIRSRKASQNRKQTS